MKKNILMVYPEYPATYWSLEHTLRIVNKKSLTPPLGLMTVAAMLPPDYRIKLVDMNTADLRDEDIMWADMVFISAMIVQKNSFMDVVDACIRLGRPVTAGGPYPTSSCGAIGGVDHFILGEAEPVINRYIDDLENGKPARIYRSEEKPDIRETPVPRFDLVNVKDYGSMPVQFSRGCPFNCEFCDIIEMFGRKPRLKSVEQFIRELDAVYAAGFRGLVNIVDDNFIGNKSSVIGLLRVLSQWQADRSYPFTFVTEASINLAAEKEILDLMVECAFTRVFIGIETPDANTLSSAGKRQNVEHDILESVKSIQSSGIEVIAGFILGFDTDTGDIFDRQINFIQEAAIPVAMVGLMLALPGTRLYRRLERDGRILYETCGNNTNMLDLNFIPVMDKDKIIEGYKKVLGTIYSPVRYFERSLALISRIPDSVYKKRGLRVQDIIAFVKSFLLMAFSPYCFRYIHFLVKTLMINPRNFALAVILSVNGYHFFRITEVTLRSAVKMQDNTESAENRVTDSYELQGEKLTF
ncbi:MAG TPA: B12-binding domain-containing radical SAM protein [Spirochaetota bacterium]|nr:B12-binding domain-containing radical SAM protein [Spirochaetota bacterium]